MAELKPANENPWYVLMTLYGEHQIRSLDDHTLDIDMPLHRKNKSAWNAWAGQALSKAERKKLGEADPALKKDFDSWPKLRKEIAQVAETRRMNSGLPKDSQLPAANPKQMPDLSYIHFVKPLQLDDMILPNGANFSNSRFEENFSCAGCIIKGDVSFEWCKFLREFYFCNNTVLGECDFVQVSFDDGCTISECSFESDVNFYKSTFAKETAVNTNVFSTLLLVHYATFGSVADFSMNVFSGEGERNDVSFSNARFLGPVHFSGCEFLQEYPDLSGSVFTAGVTFSHQVSEWPLGVIKRSEDKAIKRRDSCAVIRHNLGKQGLPEAEHFFFRREMGFAAQIGGWWERLPYRLFGFFSDFGYSIARPTISLFWVWFLPALIFAAFRVTGAPAADLFEGLWAGALSFANLFPLFGFHRLWFDPSKLAALSPWLKTLGGLQTVVSLPLLFFLGLGLRTRFRMR